MEDNRRFSWSDLFIKVILVIIFILFTVWLLSLSNKGISNSLSVLTDDIFAKNIERMKEVGKEYFTIERLPEKVGDIEVLTLEKMYDKKLILELKDKFGNSCSAENSYVSIEKYDTEYQMKVYLECGEEKDYIIVIMGCYDYCDTDICEKDDTLEETKQIEYEYMKTTGGKWTDYGSWSEWSKVYVTKTNYREVETKIVNEVYSYDKTVTDTIYDEIIVTCPSGYKKTSDGTRCYKESTSNSYVEPTCPDRTSDGYTLTGRDGFACTYVKKSTQTAEPLECPSKSGWTVTRNGFTCTYTQKTTKTAEPLECPSKDGWKVTRNGFTCTYTRSYEESYQVAYQVEEKVPYQVAVGKKLVSSCSGCAAQWQTIYETRYRTEYRTAYKTEYRTVYETDTETTSCPTGFNNVNGTCTKYDTKTETKTTSCPTGFSNVSGVCTKVDTKTDTTNNATCAVGYTKSGNKCVKPIINYIYKDMIKLCSDGYTMNSDSTSCYKNVDSTVKVEDTKKVTYYRYRVREYIGGSVDYKWSTSKEDKNLINAGYKLTGRTR